MSKKNNEFFEKKNPWSEVKDELLGCYFKPYVSKILHTRKPLFYVDCFAGKGKFNDGKNGSPLIALSVIEECLKSTRLENANIHACFIELNHSEDLRNNLKGYNNVSIISGKYEDTITNLLSSKKGENIFLYIDPYGIKALRCDMFDKIASGDYNSVELLINMNSFGFVREACHALGATYDVQELDDLIEYEPTTMNASQKAINDLTNIAGGDYWKYIIDGYKSGEFDGYEAEIRFADQYCKRLLQSYKYVLNMPMVIKQGQHSKYRMIHATNHEDGCLLMNDNIYNRWQTLREIQTNNQPSFWNVDTNNKIIDNEEIKRKLKDHLSAFIEFKPVNVVLASFATKYGVLISTGDMRNILSYLENTGAIEVLREPATTSSGKKSTFFTQNNKQSVWVRCKNG